MIVGLKYIKDIEKTSAKLDLAGMGLLASALVLFSFGLVDFAANGVSALNVVLAVIGAALIPVFILYDRRLKNPLIDFEAFKIRVLAKRDFFSVLYQRRLLLRGISCDNVLAGDKSALRR